MKVKRKIRSLLVSLLCVMLLAGVLPTAALAEDQIPTDNPRYTTGVSRSKTATPLDTATWTSDVTLSLPSAEEKLDSDVVFVLDGSSSANTNVVIEALGLLRELKDAAEDSGAAVNVCVVKFKRQAYKSNWFDLSTNYDAIKAAMGTQEAVQAGEYKITWKPVTTARLDATALKKALPDVAARFTKETTVRRFSVA